MDQQNTGGGLTLRLGERAFDGPAIGELCLDLL